MLTNALANAQSQSKRAREKNDLQSILKTDQDIEAHKKMTREIKTNSLSKKR